MGLGNVSDEQIERMALVIDELDKRGNPLARGANKNVKGKKPAEQRNQILGLYATAFELLSVLQMAADTTRTVDEIRAALNPRT